VVQLNCRGLLRRDPDKLLAVIQGADVAVLSETFLSTLDPFPDLHGYRGFNFPRAHQRSALGTAGRGGVAVYVTERLAERTTLWRQSHRGEYAWLRITDIPGWRRPLYIAACYFPPARGRGGGGDITRGIDLLQSDLAEAQAEGLVLMAGDLNARTGRLTETHGMAYDRHGTTAPTDSLLQGTPSGPPRSSQDTSVNPRGRALLELCRITDMTICNGRAPGDQEGALTYICSNGGSDVDYFIACPDLFALIDRMHVSLPDDFALDHCPVWRFCRSQATEESQAAPEDQSTTARPPAIEYRLSPAATQEFVAHLEGSTAALETLTTEAALASTTASLELLAANFDNIIRTALEQAGAEKLQRARRPHQQPRRRRAHLSAEGQALIRQRRQALHRCDHTLLRQLDNRIRSLQRQRERGRRATLGQRLMAMRGTKQFWNYMSKRPPAVKVDAAAQLEYFTQQFGQRNLGDTTATTDGDF
jgi:hypothetical protein